MIKTPKTPKEDPKVTAARDREQKRADAARTEETQSFLLGQTVRRLRRFGMLKGGAPSIFGASPSAPSPSTTTGNGGYNSSGSSGSGGAIANAAFGTQPLAGTPTSGVALW